MDQNLIPVKVDTLNPVGNRINVSAIKAGQKKNIKKKPLGCAFGLVASGIKTTRTSLRRDGKCLLKRCFFSLFSLLVSKGGLLNGKEGNLNQKRGWGGKDMGGEG